MLTLNTTTKGTEMLTRESLAALVRANLTARNILRTVEWEPEDV